MDKINVKGLTLAIGISWGLFIMFLAWVAPLGFGGAIVELFGTLYKGYSTGFLGGVIGLAWGFIDGAICGLLVSVIYNRVVEKKK